MAPTYKVAVIQMYPIPMDTASNYNTAQSFIKSAAMQGARLAVLPEYHLTSWMPHVPGFEAACADYPSYITKYQELARQLDICIVPGTILEPRGRQTTSGDSSAGPAGRGQVENVAYFIESDGSIAGRYVKKNLWGPVERLHLTSSARDPHPVVESSLGKVGMLICWDIAFPEAFRELIAQGVKLILIPTFWTRHDCSERGLARNPNSEALFIDSILTSRTFENTCGIVFANAGGPPDQGYLGLSQVCAPFVGPLARLGTSAEGMLVVDLDMQIIEDAEANYRVRADLASEGWHYNSRHSGT